MCTLLIHDNWSIFNNLFKTLYSYDLIDKNTIMQNAIFISVFTVMLIDLEMRDVKTIFICIYLYYRAHTFLPWWCLLYPANFPFLQIPQGRCKGWPTSLVSPWPVRIWDGMFTSALQWQSKPSEGELEWSKSFDDRQAECRRGGLGSQVGVDQPRGAPAFAALLEDDSNFEEDSSDWPMAHPAPSPGWWSWFCHLSRRRRRVLADSIAVTFFLHTTVTT